jgi:signal transduction histidine kinase
MVPCRECVSAIVRQERSVRHREVERQGRYFMVQCYPLVLPDSTCDEAIEIITDVTAQKKLEQQQEEYAKKLEEEVNRKTAQIRKNQEIISTERKNLEKILESMQDRVFVINKDYTIQYMNKMLVRTYGNRVGRKCHELIHGKHSPCQWCQSEKVFEKKETVRWTVHSPKDNNYYDIIESPMVEPDGKVSALVIMRDITEMNQMAEELRLNESRLEALLNLSNMTDVTEGEIASFALEEGVMLTSSKIGYMHFVNEDQVSVQLYSWSKSVLKDCKAEKTPHYPLESAGVWVDCVRQRKPVIHNDYQNLKEKKGYPDGHVHLVRHMSVPVFEDDKIVAVAGVGNKEDPYDESDVRQLSLLMNGMWDHLRHKRAVEEIKRYSSSLEEKVQKLVEEVRIKDRLALLGEISAGLAHELRNPLGSLVAGIKLLGREGKSEEEKKTIHEILKKESNRLNKALGDFLDYARPKKLQLTSVDINQLLDEILKLVRQDTDLARDNKIETDYTPSLPSISADSDRLRQVFWNILVNGLKSMEGKGTLSVKTGVNTEWLQVEISDTGKGIAPENIEKIFTPFFSLRKGGTGLGLAIAQRIMEEHRGKIEVESEEGKGTRFTIKFPLNS